MTRPVVTVAPDGESVARRAADVMANHINDARARSADVLFGRRPFTGRLPVSWPRTLAQEPINVGDPHYDPLFPYGYGLTTGSGHSEHAISDRSRRHRRAARAA